LLHIVLEHSQVVFIVYSPTVDCILQDPIDLLPGDACSLDFLPNALENCFTSFEVTIRKLVVLGPSLRNESSSLLYESMEPRKNKY